MITENLHMCSSVLESIRAKKGIATALFCLLSICFVIENNILYEGDISELTESPEKEKDQKEKKLFSFSILEQSQGHFSTDELGFSFYNLHPFSCVYPDITTPPPEFIG